MGRRGDESELGAPDFWVTLPRWAFWTICVAIFIAVLLLAVAGFVYAADLYVEPTLPPPDPNPTIQAAQLARYATEHSGWQAAVSTTRTSVLATLAGIGALVTIGINLRNSNTQQANARVAGQTLATAQETFRITERGHQTGRYTAAIEQLGNSESIAIRLGGIYALEQLARDSGRPGDQATVVEVLSAFIRVNTRRATAISPGPVGAATPLQSPEKRASGGPAPDVAAALTVLGRLPHLEGVARADLTDADLAGGLLWSANLNGANLGGANLVGAYFGGADLAGAYLGGADLAGATLIGSCLVGTYFGWAGLVGATLEGADLTSADLSGADLSSAILREANLTGADLEVAELIEANLEGADLTTANLEGADLTTADLRHAVGVTLSEEQWAVVAVRPDGSPGAATSSGAVPDAAPRG